MYMYNVLYVHIYVRTCTCKVRVGKIACMEYNRCNRKGTSDGLKGWNGRYSASHLLVMHPSEVGKLLQPLSNK